MCSSEITMRNHGGLFEQIDPVQFTLELTPNYLISYLENTGSRSPRYVSMPHLNESSVLPKCFEKSDPEVARPAFST